MLSHNQPELTSHDDANALKLVWFIDGVGITNGTNTYTARASNIFLNLGRITKFGVAPLAYFASSMQGASAFQDAESFQVKGTNFRFWAESWDFHGNKLGDIILSKLRNGMCNVVPIKEFAGWGDDDCIDMRTTDRFWLFSIDSGTQTTCANIYHVSKCIADFALGYNQTSAINPPFAPNETTTGYTPPPPNSDDDNSLSGATTALFAGVSLCALGTLAFFGRKLYKHCVTKSGYRPFHADCSEPENYNCPIHLDLMEDPQELDCGHNIDLSSLKALPPNEDGDCLCPICREIIKEPKPNDELKKAIETYKEKHSEVAIIIENDEVRENGSSPKIRM